MISMKTRIHFDDNVYIVEITLNVLASALELDIDPEVFLKKNTQDLFFIDSTLKHFHEILQENDLLIHRKEYLQSLLHCKYEFITLAQGIVQGKYRSSDLFRPQVNRILSCIREQEDECELIRSQLFDSTVTEESTDGMSSEEYHFLLGDTGTANDDH